MNRDDDGRFATKPAARNTPGAGGKGPSYADRVRELRKAGAKAEIYEDRRDKRLRFGEESHGWWYMTKGRDYWVREGKKPEMINGFLYKPGQRFPHRNISEQPGGQVWVSATSVVPDDIRAAAQTYPGDSKTETQRTRAGVANTRAVARRKPTTPNRKVTKR